MRDSLLALAAGAAAWAIAVSGVATNRPFAAFLFAVAALLLTAALNEKRLAARAKSRPMRSVVLILVAVTLAALVGGYLANTYNQPTPDAIDAKARQDVSDVRAKLASLEGQVKAAMDFQARDKAEREEARQKEEAARRASERLYATLSGIVEDGRKLRLDLFDLKKADAEKKIEDWANQTPVNLRQLGLTDCAQAFEHPVHGPGVSYSLPEKRNDYAFGAIALIEAVENCRRDHTQPPSGRTGSK